MKFSEAAAARFSTYFEKPLVRKFLRMVKRPQQGKAIHDALLEGGFTTKARNFYSNLYTAMMRSDDIVNLGGTKGWGLAEWYSGRRFEQQVEGEGWRQGREADGG